MNKVVSVRKSVANAFVVGILVLASLTILTNIFVTNTGNMGIVPITDALPTSEPSGTEAESMVVTGSRGINIDGDDYYFMDTSNYEQMALRSDILGDAPQYLLPNTKVTVNFYQNNPIGIEMPGSVELRVTETEPQLKTATVTSSYKPAIVETGLKVQVPPFISEGEVIRVDTNDGKYLERAK